MKNIFELRKFPKALPVTAHLAATKDRAAEGCWRAQDFQTTQEPFELQHELLGVVTSDTTEVMRSYQATDRPAPSNWQLAVMVSQLAMVDGCKWRKSWHIPKLKQYDSLLCGSQTELPKAPKMFADFQTKTKTKTSSPAL